MASAIAGTFLELNLARIPGTPLSSDISPNIPPYLSRNRPTVRTLGKTRKMQASKRMKFGRIKKPLTPQKGTK